MSQARNSLASDPFASLAELDTDDETQASLDIVRSLLGPQTTRARVFSALDALSDASPELPLSAIVLGALDDAGLDPWNASDEDLLAALQLKLIW